MGSRGIAPFILNFGTRWSVVFCFTPRSLNPRGTSPWFRMSGLLSGSEGLSRDSTPGRSAQPLQGLYESLPVICIMSLFYITSIVFHLLPLFKYVCLRVTRLVWLIRQGSRQEVTNGFGPLYYNLTCTYEYLWHL